MKNIFTTSLALGLTVIGHDVFSSVQEPDENKQAALTLKNLPNEILSKIADYLEPSGLKSLRLADEHFHSIVDCLGKLPGKIQGYQLGAFIKAYHNKRCPFASLTVVRLNENNLDLNQFMTILENNKLLKKLTLNESKIGTEGAKTIAYNLKYNTSLKELELGGNNIPDEEIKCIAGALKENSSLMYMGLGGNCIRDEGAQAIADALKHNTSIKELRLMNNYIMDEGAQAIADALKSNTSLQVLYLSLNYIGNAGAQAIADSVKQNKSLQKLTLFSNKIGDEARKQIKSNLQSIKSIDFAYL